MLKPLQDRGALCESQRGLAEVLIRKGHIDEAERVALEAVETVAPQDVSSQATTAMTLGLVRAAQGRDAEAEALLRESLALIESSGFRGLEGLVVTRLAEFLSAHGREEEAAPYTARLAELAPAAGGRARLRLQDGPDRLRRLLVRRLRDHRRRPLELRERLGSGSARSVPSP